MSESNAIATINSMEGFQRLAQFSTSAAAKAGHPISWGRYCKKVAPATVLVLVICTIGLFVRYL